MPGPWSTPLPAIDPSGGLPQEGPPGVGDRLSDWAYHFNDPKMPPELDKNRFGPSYRYPIMNGRQVGPGDFPQGESLWDIIRSLFGGK